jgi:hypothetical protein
LKTFNVAAGESSPNRLAYFNNINSPFRKGDDRNETPIPTFVETGTYTYSPANAGNPHYL